MTNEELGKIVRDLFYQATAPELGVLGGRVGDLEAQVKRVESWAGEKFTELNKRLVELEGWSKRTEGARVVYLDGVKGSKEDVLGRLENHLSVLSKHQDRLLSLEAQVKALSAKKVPAGAYPAELEHPCFEDPDDVVDCLAFGVESCDHKNRKDGTWDNCTSGKFSEHYTQGQPPSSLASAVAQEGLAEWEARIRAEERAKCEAEVCDHHNEFEAKIRAEERERVAKWMEATDHYMGAAIVRSMPPAPAPEVKGEAEKPVADRCPVCDGSGLSGFAGEPCQECDGSGDRPKLMFCEGSRTCAQQGKCPHYGNHWHTRDDDFDCLVSEAYCCVPIAKPNTVASAGLKAPAGDRREDAAAFVRRLPPGPVPEARDEIVNTVDSTEVPAPEVKGGPRMVRCPVSAYPSEDCKECRHNHDHREEIGCRQECPRITSHCLPVTP